MSEASEQRPAYEPSDVNPRLIAALAIGAAIFLAATPYVLLAAYSPAHHEPAIRPVTQPPAPRLQIDPAAELDALRTSEQSRLSSYGWSDRPQGVVHVPIDRALTLTAQRGLPGWPKP